MATYATWNPEDKHDSITLSEGNLLATAGGSNWRSVRANQGKSSGKWYFEYTALDATYWLLGIGTADASVATYTGANDYSYGYQSLGRKYHGGSWQSFGDTYGVGDVIGVAVDLDNGKLYWSKNGVWQESADPANGTNPAFTGLVGTFYPMGSPYGSGGAIRANFGASAFSYPVPSGYNSGWYEDSGGADTDTLIQAQPLRQYGISGPATATDNEVPVFDGTTGKKIKSGGGLIISENLMQAENKALLLEGATGDTPTSGAGTRMMYIPSKGAFRAGKVSGDQWDDANIGSYSFACGLNTKASKISFASGLGDAGGILEASGDGSFCSGASKIFMNGISAKLQALSLGSFAQGAVVSAMSGEASIKSSSYGSFAQGYSYAVGELKTIEATNNGAFAHGYTLTGSIIASGQNSMAIGDDVTASASNSIVFGLSCVNATANSMRIGWSANNGIHVKGQELWFGDTDNLFSLDVGTTNGLQIGKSASQKLGFFGTTPVTQRLKADHNNWASLSDVVGALVSLGLFDQV